MIKLAKTRDEYHEMRRCFLPGTIRLVIVAESPPISGLYFYDVTGKSTEPLFSALMKQLPFSPTSKENGLKEFQKRGWILVDATYEPVNRRDTSNRVRNNVILKDYERLKSDLKSLLSDRSTPLILIKTNVCRILEPKLVEDGYNVLNRGCVVPFPSSVQQTNFDRHFGEILKSAGL